MPKIISALLLFCAAAVTSFSQPAATPPSARGAASRPPSNAPLFSPEIQKDGRIAFRLRAPAAQDVKLSGEWGGNSESMTKNEEGVWSATVGPLPPELYGYAFVVDGVRIPDPGNPALKPMRSPTTSILEIPGQPPLIHDFRQVPHGAVTEHWYRSSALGIWRRLHVYTPPGYNTERKTYPALYLFHGSGDNDATWTVLGRANVILDNLIAEKKAKPMVIVMPDGHPLAGQITGAVGPAMTGHNVEAFADDVLDEVIPLVEENYRVIRKRESRAIAGLSMGGGQSIYLGLNRPDLFGYVAGFSSYVQNPSATSFAVFDSVNKPILLWTACGKDDRLVENAKQLSDNLTRHGIKHELVITDGSHSWPVWRKYLAQFAPLLF